MYTLCYCLNSGTLWGCATLQLRIFYSSLRALVLEQLNHNEVAALKMRVRVKTRFSVEKVALKNNGEFKKQKHINKQNLTFFYTCIDKMV